MQKFQDSVALIGGNAVAGASVLVKTIAGVTATIYSDNGSTTTTNPLTTDSNGRFSFYAADGRYSLTISGNGLTTTTVTDILLEDPVSAGDDILFLPSGSGAQSRSVQAKLREIITSADYSTEAAARTAAIAAKPAGFQTDKSPAGALMRIGHRLMIGDAVEAGGTFADTTNSWLGGSAANLRWVERDAQFETLSGVGLTAVLGGSRSSDTSNVSSWYGTSTASIGIVGIGYNDETGSARHVWGGYFEGKRGDVAGGSTGQGVTYGVEIDAINNGSAFVDRNPYSVSSADGVTIGLIIASGGDVTINPNALDATWGIAFANNSVAFGTGIAFVPGSLRARSDTYGKKRAMSLPATACIDWWQNDDTRFAAITGTYTAGDATHSATQSFASAAVNFYDQSDLLYATIGLSSTSNYLKNSLGVGTTSPDRNLHSEVDDATNNGVTRVLRLTHTTSGTPTAQIGVGMDFETESLGGNKVGAEILMRFTDVTSGQEDARIIFNVMRNGATAAQVLYLTAADTPVNYVAISGEPTGVGPVITADGETDVDLNLISKGAGNLVLNPSTGDIKWGKALVALGGGATATLGTIGGSGPGTAGQNTWMRLKDSTGAAFWVPAWK